MAGQVFLFGIRHHGPGSARRLVQALDDLKPAAVLIEGPSEASELLPMLADPDMATPVALLIYAEDNPANASFFPFAEYSPEYQAARWAVRHGAPLRFIDLPASDRLGVAGGGIEDETAASADDDPISRDPIGALATAAGYDDGESWWSDVIEENPALGAGVRRGRRCDDGAARGIEAALGPRSRARGAYADRDREGRKGVRGRDRGGVRRLACAGADRASQPRGRSRIAQGAAEGEDQGDLGAMDCAAAGARRAAMAPAWSRPAGARICGRRATAPIAARCGLPGSRTCCAIAGISSRPPR